MEPTSIQENKDIQFINEQNQQKNNEKRAQKRDISFHNAFRLSIVFFLIPTLLLTLLRFTIVPDISRAYLPLIAFPFHFLIIRIVFPKKLKIPFGEIDANDFGKRIGLYVPKNLGKNIILGIILGLCTITGMLVASIQTGRYVFDTTGLTKQIIFSTAPGVWEEVYFRGIIMIALIKIVKDVKKATIYQCIIFAILHLGNFDFWSVIDIISVFFIGLLLTYVARKTNSLIPGIIFHFLHDAFLFLVQVPDGVFIGTFENVIFYAWLWGMLLIGAVIKIGRAHV